MNHRTRSRATIVVATMLVLVAAGSVAHAFVLADPKADKDAIGNRADIAGQTLKLVACLRKAADSCERGQISGSQSCVFTGSLSAPTTMFSGSDAKMKGIAATFEAATQKCIAGVDFAKKGAKNGSPADKYRAIGCPSHCARIPPGLARCADLTTFEQAWLVDRLFEQNYVTAAVRALSVRTDPMDTRGCALPMTTDPKLRAQQAAAFDRCATRAASAVTKFQNAVGKCQAACETDYADKKGGGGPTDGPPTCALVGGDPSDPLAICVAKATAGLERKSPPYALVGPVAQLQNFLTEANRSLFNQPDACLPQS